MSNEPRYVVFAGFDRIADGDVQEAARAAKAQFDANAETRILVYDRRTGQQVDFDLHGTPDEVAERVATSAQRRGRGRPKLGVECGELCLLPRHWEWLAAQPRSASATIRRLIDAARKRETPQDHARERVDAAGAFMWSIAGDLPGFEEASRALYAGDRDRLDELTSRWPADVRLQIRETLGEEPSGGAAAPGPPNGD